MGDHERVRVSDRLQAAVVRALSRLPDRTKVHVSGEGPICIDGQRLDPQLQLLRALRRLRRAPGLLEPHYLTARARFHREMVAFAGPPTEVGAVRDFTIPGEGGPLPVRHYAPAATSTRAPLTVYLHGGGFVIGDRDAVDEACRIICREADTHVLSVDYRLAPEHPYPAALHDTRAALRWARANAASLGADPSRIAAGGDSAGANLATVAARLETREGEPLAAQLLIYPPTDSETPRPSWTLFASGYFLTTADREGFARLYLQGTNVRGDDPCISPLLAPDLAGLPPALVVTAGYDPLRDEGEAYAMALRDAGTRTLFWREASLTHGFVNMPGVCPPAREALVRIAREWRAMLAAPRARGAAA